MTWRFQFLQQNIRRIDLLHSATTNVVAAWTQADRVHFYDMKTGTGMGERTIEKLSVTERSDPRWQDFLKTLVAPNDVYLPLVRHNTLTIHNTEDGRIRLYQPNDAPLSLEVNGKEGALPVDDGVRFTALDMDHALGLLAALDSACKLHIFQQRIRVGIFETGLALQPEYAPLVHVSNGGKQIFVSDGEQMLVYDAGGKQRRRTTFHYPVGLVAVSGDGKSLVTNDAETNVLRVYNGDDFTPSHQRFALDLAAEARRVQANAGVSLSGGTLTALAISGRGAIAFAINGLLCVAPLAKLKALPKASTSTAS
jgi:WD40 repeat protein